MNHLLVDWIMNDRRDDPDDLVATCAEMFGAVQTHHDAITERDRSAPREASSAV